MRTPLGYFANRYTISPRALRWATTAALVVSILIVLTGGVVRLTGSGLGCPTWPECEAGSIATTPALGIHGLIEFTNRVFTGVISIAVGWVIVAARLQNPRVRAMTRLAWSQFWLVIANAVAGGISVITGLNPWVVAMHFVLAIALLTTTTLTWHRAHDRPTLDGRVTDRASRNLSSWLVALTLALVVIGTLVTGSGPHSGDSAAVPRMGFDWATVTVIHGVLATLTIVLAVALFARLRAQIDARLALRRVIVFVVVLLAQGLIGIVQALNGLPEVLVALHLLGAALVWVGALRVLLDVQPSLFSASRLEEGLPERITAP
jgi:cytochrome c oxidase assembly protein subunit 15